METETGITEKSTEPVIVKMDRETIEILLEDRIDTGG